MDGIKPLNFASIKCILAAATLACAIACAGSVAGLTETGAIMIAIDKMTLGSELAEFDFARTGRGGPARWAVTSDASAAVGLAIEQTSTDTIDYRFPLAIYRPVSASGVDVTVRFKAVAGCTSSVCGRKVNGSRSRLTASNCSPRPTAHLPAQARSRSGPRPTV